MSSVIALRALALPRWLPGLGLVVLVAIVARVLGRFTGPIPDVVLALVIGMSIRNFVRPKGIEAGTKFTLFYVLRTAIVLLGAGLSLQAVIRTGSATLLLIVTLVVTSMLLGLLLARLFNLKGKIGTLIGAGTAICGGSAERLDDAIALMTICVGGMALARAVDDEDFSARILRVARETGTDFDRHEAVVAAAVLVVLGMIGCVLWRTGVGVFTPGAPAASDAGMALLNGPRDWDGARRLIAQHYKNEPVVMIGVHCAATPSSS